MSKQGDDLEAVRVVVDALQGFDVKDQQRIFRWAAEKLGLPQPFGTSIGTAQGPLNPPAVPAQDLPNADSPSPGVNQDIRSFVAQKSPKSDIQFAATVAYYYQFVAPEAEKKSSITEDDLREACRRVDRKRPPKPYFTLNNAYHAGLLDRMERGAFSINSVGENLVAVTLPSPDGVTRKAPKKRPKRAGVKSSGKKRAAKGKREQEA